MANEFSSAVSLPLLSFKQLSYEGRGVITRGQRPIPRCGMKYYYSQPLPPSGIVAVLHTEALLRSSLSSSRKFEFAEVQGWWTKVLWCKRARPLVFPQRNMHCEVLLETKGCWPSPFPQTEVLSCALSGACAHIGSDILSPLSATAQSSTCLQSKYPRYGG